MKGPRVAPRLRVREIAFALGLGAAGGAVFSLLRLPLPWMLGAAIVTTVAALAGVRIALPRPWHQIVIAVLGLMLGSTYTPETLVHAQRWLPSMGGVALYAVAAGTLTAVLVRRCLKTDPVTSFFAAMPGGFSDMVIVGAAMGGDVRMIALVHAVRILSVAVTIPFWFRIVHHYQPAGFGIPFPMVAGVRPLDLAVLALSAVVGVALARRLRLPAAVFTGPMLLSAALHVTGVTAAQPPGLVIAVAQVVLGASIGSRFTGYDPRRMRAPLLVGVASAVGMVTMAGTFAVVLGRFTGLPFEAVFLAFSPGGLTEMTLISLSLGIDTALVTTHHMARIFLLVMMAPLAFKLMAPRLGVNRGPPLARDHP